ncbi:SGNH/GDSL hydrolase family protein [Malacoplasma muris]|uniref:SGNH/GDSL hydrolase family protein n=1 Tax=Malacoplasma muris TaxID=2119 RepID=UPI00398F4A0E
MRVFKKMLLSLSIFSLSFPIIVSGCSIKKEIGYKNYEEISKIFSSLKLGSEIVTNAKTVKVIFNNFGFFGGSDISADIYDWFKDDGYKNQIELFEIYQKWKGPYDLQGEYANVKYTYGKRGFFDFSHSNYTIKNAVEIFDGVTKENDIWTTIYNIDTDDVLNVNENDFKTYLKLFIDKSLLLRNNTGMVIIKNHYYTNDNEFNKKNSLVNNYIKEVIVENYKNDQSKLNRINFVDHTSITQNNPFVLNQDQKFVDFCFIENNKLNAYGNLEMVYDLIKTIYPESVAPPIQNISIDLLENNKPDHKITGDNKYVIQYLQQSNKMNNFQKYLSNLNKANWYFLGDSITAGSMNTKGYKTYVDYLKSLIKTDFKRPNDLIVNGAVYGGTIKMNIILKMFSLINIR